MSLQKELDEVNRHRDIILAENSSWLEYVQTHQDYPESNKDDRHRALEEAVARTPEAYGLPANAKLYREVALHCDRSRQLTIIDIAAICDGQPYLVEIKASQLEQNPATAQIQQLIATRPLKVGYLFFREIFGISPQLILIYLNDGGFCVKSIPYSREKYL